MKCPLHVSVEMVEHRELTPFCRTATTQEEDTGHRRHYRTVCHCPVTGCIQVGLIENDFTWTRKKAPVMRAHV